MQRRLIVAADDLEKGMFVTFYDMSAQPTGSVQYANMNGIPIAVDAISLPFFKGTIVLSSNPIIVDTRLCTLCRLTDEYVDAIRATVTKTSEGTNNQQPTNGDSNGPESSGCPAAI